MKETQIDELKTLPEAPEVLHINVGMKGKLHTYVRVPIEDAMDNTQGVNEARELGERVAQLSDALSELETHKSELLAEIEELEAAKQERQDLSSQLSEGPDVEDLKAARDVLDAAPVPDPEFAEVPRETSDEHVDDQLFDEASASAPVSKKKSKKSKS